MAIGFCVTQKTAELELETVANSGAFRVMGFDPWTGRLRIKVKSKALKGEANKELLSELEKFFDKKVTLVSGEKSRKKTILLDGISGSEVKEILAKKAKS